MRERAATWRLPRHVGFIPDGNRRWADARGRARHAGYAAGIEPGLSLLRLCREIGIREVSIYGFTKDNVKRPAAQVEAFRRACTAFARKAIADGAALLVVGDVASGSFPAPLKRYARERSGGAIRVNLLVNYGWEWDLDARLPREGPRIFASSRVSPIDLVVRWGGRHRLSGFLPLQCAYADIYTVDRLWPDMQPGDFLDALRWYQGQDVTRGG